MIFKTPNSIKFCILTFSLQLFSFLAQAEESQDPAIVVNLGSLSQAPIIDGEISEWGNDEWSTLILKPAMKKNEKKLPEALNVELKTAIVGDMFYVAVKWPDAEANLEYKNWVWRMNKYKRDKKKDDMFALRFDMGGDYNQCMISKSDYKVDVWLWSSGRSNLTDYAEDMNHHMSTRLIENAAEYEFKREDGTMATIYIKKRKDSGKAPYKNARIKRKKKIGKKINSIKLVDKPSGSVIDVKAKGKWLDGFWTLEMARKLDTANKDDVVLSGRDAIKGAVAVFNHNSSEHKNNSNTLLFKLKP
jgi:hypothetical protein